MPLVLHAEPETLSAEAMRSVLPPPTGYVPPQPRQPQYRWFQSSDYPAEALRRREQGVVRYRVEIDAQGQPSDCRIAISSGSRILDDTTCLIVVQRGRFVPARDGNGQAVSGTYTGNTRWTLPPQPAQPPRPVQPIAFVSQGGLPVLLRFSGSRRNPQCKVESSDPEVSRLGKKICAAYRRGHPRVAPGGAVAMQVAAE